MPVTAAIALAAFIACAAACAQGAKQQPLPDADRARIERTLREALDARDISELLYQQSLAFLHDSRCDVVDRRFTPAEQAKWSAAIATRKPFSGAKALKSFRVASWRLVYASLPELEPAFMFYAGSKPATEWSGSGAIFDAPDIEQWVLVNAPGIPRKLAHCFAWHVTFSADR